MLKISRIVFAFLFSPLVGFFLIQLFLTGPYMLPISENLFIGFRMMLIGLTPLLILYVVLIFVSIPVFLLVKYLIGWKLWSCIVASTATSTTAWALLTILNQMTSNHESLGYFSSKLFITGSVLGTIMYGIVFWLFVKKRV